MRGRITAFLEKRRPQYGTDLEAALFQLTPGLWDAPYIASFSAEPDFLPQWRSYCPNGNGVSIGFRTEKLRQSTCLKSPNGFENLAAFHSSVHSVLYLDERDDEAVDDLLERCLVELDDWHNEQENLDPEERTSADDDRVLEAILSRWAGLVKHPGFASEKEQRLVAPIHIFPSTDIHYRSSKTTVVPYAEVRMPKGGQERNGLPKHAPSFSDYYIAEVIVGPTPNPDLTSGALQHLFARKNVPVVVRPSAVPFRDL